MNDERYDPSSLALIVVARDEEDRIEACLRSAGWAGERIVVVDDATADATAERARPLATDLVVRPWDGFVPAKRFAISRTRAPWILWLDADETISDELARSIRAALAAPGDAAGFRARRLNRYLGRVVRHGAWSGDRVVRLFRRDRADFDDRFVHEGLRVEGKIVDLPGVIHHASYRDLSHHWRKIGEWADLWCAQAARDRKSATILDPTLRPIGRFIKGYLFKGGFLDGRAGLVLAVMDSVYVAIKYARLLEERERARTKTGASRREEP